MGVVKCMKVMKKSGQGRMYLVCSVCENYCDAYVHGYKDVSRNDDIEFTCKSCAMVTNLRKELLALKARFGVTDNEEGIVQSEEVENLVGNSDESEEVFSLVDEINESSEVGLDEITQGVVLGDSMVRGIGNVVCSKKRNTSRCCLPGARVNDVIDVVRKSDTVKKDDKVVLWVGTNEVGSATNVEFKRETTTLLREIKGRTKDITVLGLLPRFPGWRSRLNVESQRSMHE